MHKARRAIVSMTSAYMRIISLTPLAGTDCGNMSVWGWTKHLGVHTMAE